MKQKTQRHNSNLQRPGTHPPKDRPKNPRGPSEVHIAPLEQDPLRLEQASQLEWASPSPGSDQLAKKNKESQTSTHEQFSTNQQKISYLEAWRPQLHLKSQHPWHAEKPTRPPGHEVKPRPTAPRTRPRLLQELGLRRPASSDGGLLTGGRQTQN